MRLRKEYWLRVPESSHALAMLRPRVVVLFAWPRLAGCCRQLLLPDSVACTSTAAAAAALFAPAQKAVRRTAARLACASASTARLKE
jgi:hypothetical protein